MILADGGCLRIQGAMVKDTARALLQEGRRALSQEVTEIDVSAVAEADSSAVAVLLGLLRSANERGLSIRFSGMPAGMLSLAELYGVADLLPQA